MKHIAADENDLLDLVNDQDQVIGTINQAEAEQLLTTKAGFVRGVAAFIQNSDGKLWIPRRAAIKRIVPGGLDFSVAEHVRAGETYEQAVIRGFAEELYLDVTPNELICLGKLDPLAELPYFFIAVFLYHADEIQQYNHADYSGFEWLTPAEVVTRIENGEPTKNALKESILSFL